MNAIAASRHEEFAGRLQSTGNKAELYAAPMETGSNSRYERSAHDRLRFKRVEAKLDLREAWPSRHAHAFHTLTVALRR